MTFYSHQPQIMLFILPQRSWISWWPAIELYWYIGHTRNRCRLWDYRVRRPIGRNDRQRRYTLRKKFRSKVETDV